MAGAKNQNEMLQYIIEVIEELTQAVHDHIFQSSKYSPLVNRAMEYLNMNYSQNITGPELCQYLGISVSHFSKNFNT